MSKVPTWQELSFLDNLAAAVDALGFDKAGLAWGIAKTRFESVEDRERFLNTLVSQDARELEARERGRFGDGTSPLAGPQRGASPAVPPQPA